MRTRSAVVVAVTLSIPVAGCGPASPGDANAAAAEAQPSAVQEIDWQAVDAAMGRAGAEQADGIHRYGFPRTDLRVTADGVQISPALALGGWIAMKPSADGVVAMGDLVLREDEVDRVIPRLQEGGVGQTAIHKHLPAMSPDVWWTHVRAEGDPMQIARTVRDAVALTATPAPSQAGAPPPLALDTAQIRQILGRGGRNNSGVYSVSFPRAETIRAMGIEVPPSMGISTAIGFQPTGDGKAAISGDFVMTAGEVDSVISALRENGIRVVSLHNHMTDEEPRLFFTHFWANDDALKLAHGLRAALDRTNVQRAESGEVSAGTTAQDRTWSFDDVSPGQLPAGWRTEQTNPRGEGAQWSVALDRGAPSGDRVLSLTDPRGARGSTYNLAWTGEASFHNGRIEVKVKAGTGREDQGGGPVWRVQDRDNYYVARWNPLEDNVRLYYVRNGNRRELASADVDVRAGEWHTLTIEQRGNLITGYFDGQRVWEETDDTFAGAGGVGVWTKADAASFFDDLAVTGGAAR